MASAQRTSERAAPVPSTPERATAQSPEGAYWRRVLGEIVTARR